MKRITVEVPAGFACWGYSRGISLALLIRIISREYAERDSCGTHTGLMAEIVPVEGFGNWYVDDGTRTELSECMFRDALQEALQQGGLAMYVPSQVQLSSAYSVARFHGHGWSSHWDSIQCWAKACGSITCQLIHELSAPFEWGSAVTMPTADGLQGSPNLCGETMTGRLAWSVYQNGVVRFTVNRPGKGDPQAVLVLYVTASGEIKRFERPQVWDPSKNINAPPMEIGGRHIEAVAGPIGFLRGQIGYAKMKPIVSEIVRMLPDEAEREKMLGDFAEYYRQQEAISQGERRY